MSRAAVAPTLAQQGHYLIAERNHPAARPKGTGMDDQGDEQVAHGAITIWGSEEGPSLVSAGSQVSLNPTIQRLMDPKRSKAAFFKLKND